MAGVYLRDAAGLRPVLVTEAGKWWADGMPAEEIFYAHPQPDLPGRARVIWGPRLFGQVTLEAEFSAAAVHRAAAAAPRASRPPAVEERPMAGHEVVSRLIELQTRRQELAAALAGWRHDPPQVRYAGYVTGQLAFSLGRAGPLAEHSSVATAERLHAWAQSLPAEQRRVILREPRQLRDAAATTPAADRPEAGASGEEDRRADYHAPPERGGPMQEGVVVWARGAAESPRRAVDTGLCWGWSAVAAGLALYLAFVVRHGWKLLTGEVWGTWTRS